MTVTALQLGPYRARRIRPVDLIVRDDWRVKVYTIGEPEPARLREALDAAWLRLPEDDHHGLGHIVVHFAPSRTYLLVCWWAEFNELHQHLLSAPLDGPFATHSSPAVGCVWELAVTDFERRAWITHVLQPADGPQIDAFLDERCDDAV
jgi:hypothetical protein